MLAPLMSVGKRKGTDKSVPFLFGKLPNLSANKVVNGFSNKPCQAAPPHVNFGGARRPLAQSSTGIGHENCYRIKLRPLHTLVGFPFYQPRLEIRTSACE